MTGPLNDYKAFIVETKSLWGQECETDESNPEVVCDASVLSQF